MASTSKPTSAGAEPQGIEFSTVSHITPRTTRSREVPSKAKQLQSNDLDQQHPSSQQVANNHLAQPAPTINRDEDIPSDNKPVALIKQPDVRPITQEQLFAEVQGIYAGLVMVEETCTEVDNNLSCQSNSNLTDEQFQALIALHRTLLFEHYDFFLASQHPLASSALKRLASERDLPARILGRIRSFLELLRQRLPASSEHMLTFIYLAYSMMTSLYETVSAFEDTWMKCLGDLSHYRIAIGDEMCDMEVWTAVSDHWSTRARQVIVLPQDQTWIETTQKDGIDVESDDDTVVCDHGEEDMQDTKRIYERGDARGLTGQHASVEAFAISSGGQFSGEEPTWCCFQ